LAADDEADLGFGQILAAQFADSDCVPLFEPSFGWVDTSFNIAEKTALTASLVGRQSTVVADSEPARPALTIANWIRNDLRPPRFRNSSSQSTRSVLTGLIASMVRFVSFMFRSR
jgi:hypothetical protein